jgi:hypothetical protein
VPLSIAAALVNIFTIGMLACVTVPVRLGLWLYQLYLTFLGIRSGMNLPAGRALAVILIPVLLLLLLLFCGLVTIIVAVNAAKNGASIALTSDKGEPCIVQKPCPMHLYVLCC